MEQQPNKIACPNCGHLIDVQDIVTIKVVG